MFNFEEIIGKASDDDIREEQVTIRLTVPKMAVFQEMLDLSRRKDARNDADYTVSKIIEGAIKAYTLQKDAAARGEEPKKERKPRKPKLTVAA